jgi:3-hydroxyacyl-CoA dehydrogenase
MRMENDIKTIAMIGDKSPQALKDMVDRGELGVKSRQGFYPIKKRD